MWYDNLTNKSKSLGVVNIHDDIHVDDIKLTFNNDAVLELRLKWIKKC